MMKSIKKYLKGSFGFIVAGVLFSSCEKKFDAQLPLETDFNNLAIVQVYMATVNTSRNYVYVDSKPVNGSSLTLGSIFPTTGYGFNVPSGTRAFLVRDTLSAATQPPISFAQDLKVGKHYTVFMYDTFTTPKQKTIEDNIVIPSDNTARIRFANMIYNPGVLPNGFDIYSVKKNAVVFSNVKETEVTEYITHPSAITDTFYIRPSGSSTNLQNIDSAGRVVFLNIQTSFTPTPKRNYTIIFRGGFRSNANKTNAGVAIGSARALTAFANY